jgi:hypothetical protein
MVRALFVASRGDPARGLACSGATGSFYLHRDGVSLLILVYLPGDKPSLLRQSISPSAAYLCFGSAPTLRQRADASAARLCFGSVPTLRQRVSASAAHLCFDRVSPLRQHGDPSAAYLCFGSVSILRQPISRETGQLSRDSVSPFSYIPGYGPDPWICARSLDLRQIHRSTLDPQICARSTDPGCIPGYGPDPQIQSRSTDPDRIPGSRADLLIRRVSLDMGQIQGYRRNFPEMAQIQGYSLYLGIWNNLGRGRTNLGEVDGPAVGQPGRTLRRRAESEGIRWILGRNPGDAPRGRGAGCGRAWGMRSGGGRRSPWSWHVPRERRGGSREGGPEAQG